MQRIFSEIKQRIRRFEKDNRPVDQTEADQLWAAIGKKRNRQSFLRRFAFTSSVIVVLLTFLAVMIGQGILPDRRPIAASEKLLIQPGDQLNPNPSSTTAFAEETKPRDAQNPSRVTPTSPHFSGGGGGGGGNENSVKHSLEPTFPAHPLVDLTEVITFSVDQDGPSQSEGSSENLSGGLITVVKTHRSTSSPISPVETGSYGFLLLPELEMEPRSLSNQSPVFKKQVTNGLSLLFQNGPGWGKVDFPTNTALAELRNNSERAGFSWVTEISGRKRWASGFTLATGLQYRRQVVRFDYQSSNAITEFREGVLLSGTYDRSTGELLTATFGDTLLTGVANREVRAYNTVSELTIPVRLGYGWQKNRFSLDLEAGTLIGIPMNTTNKYLTITDDEPTIVEDQEGYFRRPSISLEFGLRVGYRLSRRIGIEGSFSGRQSTGTATLLVPKTRLQQFNLGVGIRYHLIK